MEVASGGIWDLGDKHQPGLLDGREAAVAQVDIRSSQSGGDQPMQVAEILSSSAHSNPVLILVENILLYKTVPNLHFFLLVMPCLTTGGVSKIPILSNRGKGSEMTRIRLML